MKREANGSTPGSRSTLTDAELTTLTAEGQVLTLAEALSLALEE